MGKHISDRAKKELVIRAMAANDMVVAQTAASLKWHRDKVYFWIGEIIAETGRDPRCFYDLRELLEMAEGGGGNE